MVIIKRLDDEDMVIGKVVRAVVANVAAKE